LVTQRREDAKKENPFCKVKTQKSSVKVNEFVPREVVDKLMEKANPVWRVILGLRLFRVNHPVSRDDASIHDISVPALNTNTIRTHLVRILHLRYKTACFPWKNKGSGTTLATHWTTHQGARQRTRRRSTCRHGHAWIGRKAKAIGQKCEKTR
jgi:hypothetical protein